MTHVSPSSGIFRMHWCHDWPNSTFSHHMQHDLGKRVPTEYSAADLTVTDRDVLLRTGSIALCSNMYCWACSPRLTFIKYLDTGHHGSWFYFLTWVNLIIHNSCEKCFADKKEAEICHGEKKRVVQVWWRIEEGGILISWGCLTVSKRKKIITCNFNNTYQRLHTQLHQHGVYFQ